MVLQTITIDHSVIPAYVYNYNMKISDFNYNLAQNLIAQKPANPRHNSKLMVIDRKNKSIKNYKFYELSNILDKTMF
jgi:S-adenosylmethionine:tRNA-ribosyltransferase-isomerase (queuine synthetase)